MAKRMTAKQRAKERIQSAMVLDRLIKAFDGEIELSTVQANIGLRLLNKLVPDLKAVEQNNSGEINHTHSVDDQSVEQAVEKIREALDAIRAGHSTEAA